MWTNRSDRNSSNCHSCRYRYHQLLSLCIHPLYRYSIKLISSDTIWSHASEQVSLFQSIYELQTASTNVENFLSSQNWYYRLKLILIFVHGPTNKQANTSSNTNKPTIYIPIHQCYLILVQIFIEAFFWSGIRVCASILLFLRHIYTYNSAHILRIV